MQNPLGALTQLVCVSHQAVHDISASEEDHLSLFIKHIGLAFGSSKDHLCPATLQTMTKDASTLIQKVSRQSRCHVAEQTKSPQTFIIFRSVLQP
jgi:hypothetical protein